MDPKYAGETLKHLEKESELLLNAHKAMSDELHRLQEDALKDHRVLFAIEMVIFSVHSTLRSGQLMLAGFRGPINSTMVEKCGIFWMGITAGASKQVEEEMMMRKLHELISAHNLSKKKGLNDNAEKRQNDQEGAPVDMTNGADERQNDLEGAAIDMTKGDH
uniref:Uncharacterized protein n=1 Tax=Solanum lycopersicum TaxID=4081 RepID=A0A3Q7FJB2_SOLLC